MALRQRGRIVCTPRALEKREEGVWEQAPVLATHDIGRPAVRPEDVAVQGRAGPRRPEIEEPEADGGETEK